MKLNERLKRTEANEKAASPSARRIQGQHGTDPLVHLKRRAQEALFAKLGARLYDPSLSEQELQEFVTTELNAAMAEEAVQLTPEEARALASQIRDDILGFGPIQKIGRAHV